ncbi:ATP-binding protein [Kiloniella laminariae]|uniref:histidine kinase n=1 Tax=Kiloniella laminariae TaxID=454162 RepID=A0ABT4LEU6_9PROT|nr:ATP-binding protein [Kiloniella laminariae]MCZ4279619.1 ATP-binding protein [Kiloniella laminariae]
MENHHIKSDTFRKSAPIPAQIKHKWQEMVDVTAEILQIPFCLISEERDGIEPHIIRNKTSATTNALWEEVQQPYKEFISHVFDSGQSLILDDSSKDPFWTKNLPAPAPDVMSYNGHLLHWPDGKPFGTFSVFDRRARTYTPLQQQLIESFRDSLNKDLQIIHQTEELAEQTNAAGVCGEERLLAERESHDLYRQLEFRVAIEKELEKAVEQERFASRSKSDFLATMSHELRTPLNSIIGFSELIHNEAFGPLGKKCYRDYAADILAAGQHLLAVINDVLDVSKLETGEIELRETECDIQALSASCMKMVTARAVEKQLEISDITESQRNSARSDNGEAVRFPLLYADPIRIKQILINLLGNAVKFTPRQGKITLKRYLTARDQMVIEVADTGIGISPEDLPRVLEPFKQAKNILTREHEGTGLGLHIVKSMMELHGGNVELFSQLQKGTTVRLIFPAKRVLAPVKPLEPR